MLFFLLIYILTLLLTSYYLSKANLFSPAVLAFFSFSFAVFFAILNTDYWRFKVSETTIVIIILGLFSFLLGAIPDFNRRFKIFDNPRIINVSNLKIGILLCISFAIYFFYQREILRIALFAGAASYDSSSDIMETYRSSMMFSGDPEAKINTWVNQGGNFLMVLSYVFLFIFCNNKTLGAKFRKNWKNLIIVVVFIFQSLSTGGRANVLAMIAAYLFFDFVLSCKYKKTSSKNQIKYYLTVLITVALSLWSFYLIREFIGRSTVDFNFREYISMYIGGSIPLLDNYILHPIKTAYNSFGEETFMGINDFIYKFYPKIIYKTNLEFRYSPNGYVLGNVYTPFRRYFHDFGWIGVAILPFCISFCY